MYQSKGSYDFKDESENFRTFSDNTHFIIYLCTWNSLVFKLLFLYGIPIIYSMILIDNDINVLIVVRQNRIY